ncbi:MAG: Holliday junction resolvase RuvX [Nannocystaceae bacterium]
MRALGLDVGSKTIGVAISDPDGVIATARETLPRKGNVADVDSVARLARGEGARVVIVGLPLELDGSVGHRARLVKRFVAALKPALAAAQPAEVGPIAVELWDERFSTAAAERALLEADVSRARRRGVIDALAAQHILQGWLDARRRPSA